jgi:serine/threonine-protein kinase
MGVVWRGRDKISGTQYAIKVLRSEYSADPDAVTRFVRERTVLMKFRHPAVVSVRDMIVEGEYLALVMDLVEGGDLNMHRQRVGGTLAALEAARIGAQICDGLDAAHQAGIIHRDLKPANVLLSRGQVRLADFGIARIIGDQSGTTTGTVLGTAHYLAPEMLTGSQPSAASDMYAFGVTLYEMLAGRPPFSGHIAAIMHDHLATAPVRIPGVPDPLWDLVSACVSKQPETRPAAAAMAQALRAPALIGALTAAAAASGAGPHPRGPYAAGPQSPGPPVPGAYPGGGRPQPAGPPAPASSAAPVTPVPSAAPGQSAGLATPSPAGFAADPFGGIPTAPARVPGSQAQPALGAQPPWAGQAGSPPAKDAKRTSMVLAAVGAVVLLCALAGVAALTHLGPFSSGHKTIADGTPAASAVATESSDPASGATGTPGPASPSASSKSSHRATPSHSPSSSPSPSASASSSSSSSSSSSPSAKPSPSKTSTSSSKGKTSYGADVVVNGSFSGDTLQGWYSASVGIVLGGGPGGGNALKLDGSTAGVYQVVSVTPGDSYLVTGWGEADGGIVKIGAGDTDFTHEVAAPIKASSWIKGSVIFTPGPNVTSANVFCVEGGPVTGYCTDITFQLIKHS